MLKKRTHKSDVKKSLKNGLKLIADEFREKFKTFYKRVKAQALPVRDSCEKSDRNRTKDELKRDLAVCIYFASYLSPLNDSSQ